MPDDGYTTPEGFWLAKPVLLPDARAFSDVLEYLDEWKPAWSPTAGRSAETPPEPIYMDERGTLVPANVARRHGANEIGPYCTVDMRHAGGREHRGIAVRATDAAIAAVRARGIVTPDDHLSFKVIAHADRDRALVTLDHGYIIGGMWLAYVDTATIPPYPFAERDRRAREIHDAMQEAGLRPVGRTTGDHSREYTDGHGGPLAARIEPDGAVTRRWQDGTVNREPAR